MHQRGLAQRVAVIHLRAGFYRGLHLFRGSHFD